MFVTYKVTCLVTGKYYIGSHKTDNIDDDDYMGSGRFIRQSIEQYGVENHKKEILGVFDNRRESVELEHMLVKEKRIAEKEMCLNASLGGESFDYVNSNGLNVYERLPESSEKRKEASKKANDRKRWLLENDESFANRVRDNQRVAQRKYYEVHDGPFTGREHTDATKEKMSKAHKGKHTGKNNSQYGTFWITNGYTNMKWSDSRGELPNGYHRGRTK